MKKNIIPVSLALSLVSTAMAQNEQQQRSSEGREKQQQKEANRAESLDQLERLFSGQFPAIPETCIEHVHFCEDGDA